MLNEKKVKAIGEGVDTIADLVNRLKGGELGTKEWDDLAAKMDEELIKLEGVLGMAVREELGDESC